jgi:hypothetical protein
MAADSIPAAPLPACKPAYLSTREPGRRAEVTPGHVRATRSWPTRHNRTLTRPEPPKHQAPSLDGEAVTAAA